MTNSLNPLASRIFITYQRTGLDPITPKQLFGREQPRAQFRSFPVAIAMIESNRCNGVKKVPHRTRLCRGDHAFPKTLKE